MPSLPGVVQVLPKVAFAVLSGSALFRHLAKKYGPQRPTGAASRFVAGIDLPEALAAAEAIERKGLHTALDYLGAPVGDLDSATESTRQYLEIIAGGGKPDAVRHLSVSLAQLGLGVDRATALDNLRRLLDGAQTANMFVRLAMASADTTDVTLDTADTLHRIGHRNLGIVLQARLRRSAGDLDRFVGLGVSIRLVKGAYRESRAIALRDPREVGKAFQELAERLLLQGERPSIGTHDERLIGHVTQFAARHGVARDRFEFEMFLGVRPDLQEALAADGYHVRVYLPFGPQWFAYFLQRAGEQPVEALKKQK